MSNRSSSTAVVLCASVAVFMGCAQDAQWQTARTEYCQELDLLARDVHRQLGDIAGSIQGSENCGPAELDLKTMRARVGGFTTLPHVLARSRPNKQSVEDAGFVTSLGESALQQYDPRACRTGNYAEAVKQLGDIKGQVERSFKAGLDRCAAIGWKSVLPVDPSTH